MALFDNLRQYEERGKKFTGVFYVEHPTRKYGVARDRQLVIRYMAAGKRRAEVFGWLSEGATAQAAQTKIKFFQENAKSGAVPTSLAEERELLAQEEQRAKDDQEAQEKDLRRREISFDDYWQKVYFPDCQSRKKAGSIEAERYLYKKWIAPVVAHLRLIDIRPLHLRALRDKMAKEGKKPATIKYAFAVISQVWNMARADEIVQGDSPTRDKGLKMKFDNKKRRYLCPEEAALLLAKLRMQSPIVADMALLSLHCGLRAGEIFKLTWADLDLDRGALRLWDTKAGDFRPVPLTATAKLMLQGRLDREQAVRREAKEQGREEPTTELVFPGRGGKMITSISNSFDRGVSALGMNDGITDPRMRLTFHGLRHSCASLLVKAGVPLYTVSKILGHSTLRMTERYAHLADDDLRDALANVDTALAPAVAPKRAKVIKLK